MIVEIQDYRIPLKSKERRLLDETKPQMETIRTVLIPTGESIWADICLMNQKAGGKWSDQESLDVESKILVRRVPHLPRFLSLTVESVQLATSDPLCLDPNPKLGRIANSMARVSRPRSPPPLRPNKRKVSQTDQAESDEAALARKVKLMQFRNPQMNRPQTPTYAVCR